MAGSIMTARLFGDGLAGIMSDPLRRFTETLAAENSRRRAKQTVGWQSSRLKLVALAGLVNLNPVLCDCVIIVCSIKLRAVTRSRNSALRCSIWSQCQESR